MPAFQRFPKEAEIIGRLLAGYGELEFLLGLCVNFVLHGDNAGLKTLFRLRSEAHRLDIADALLRPSIIAWKIEPNYKKTLDAIRHCKSIRNQFAHCHWGDHEDGGLFFVKIEDWAKQSDDRLNWFHVDVPLLEKHDAYFFYAIKCLTWLNREVEIKRYPERRDNYFRMPKGLQPPPLHNRQDRHIPPWQSLDDQPQPQPQTQGNAKPSRSRGSERKG